MRFRFIIAALIAVVLVACASPPVITNQPPGSATDVVVRTAASNSTVAQGLQDASWNLDQAIAIGVLAPDDPAASCLHSTLRAAGIEPTPGSTPAQSYTPKVSDLISAGSVLYIQAQQAKVLSGMPLTAPVACDAVVGMIVRDSLNTAARMTLPGAITNLLR